MSFSDPVGFSGLADLVSDVAADVDAAERAARAPASPPVPRTPAPSPRPAAKSGSGGLAALLAAIPGKLWVFGGIAALAWMCDAASSKPSRYSASSTYSSRASSSGNSGYGVPSSAGSSYGTSDYTETKPPVGSGRSLSTSELRYCVFEDERIGYMKPLVTDNGRVDTFNMYVQDYNSRCSQFRYMRGTLEAVRREAAERAASLQSEARLRFY